MKKLFALEEAEELATVDLEASPEEGEVADVQVDAEEEGGELEAQAAAIDEGVEAGGQMEEVEALVEGAVEEGEGLDPVAAEAIAIAVRAIGARVGFQSGRMESLYAAENFSSASSRKANTTFALEGVKEFLKDLWKKIKAAIDNLWTKVKAFWEKHISSLGRIKKALESAKTKLAESSGKLKDKAYLEEIPGAMDSAFGHVGDVNVGSIKEVIAAHRVRTENGEKVSQATETFNQAAAAIKGTANLDKEIESLAKALENKGTTSTLVGGVTVTYTVKRDGDEGGIEFEVEKEQVDRKDKGGISLAEKSDVKGLLDDTLKIINDTIKVKEKQAKLQESFNKFALAVDKEINAQTKDQKEMRNTMKAVYKINAKSPTILTEIATSNIRLAKAVIGYAALCMKNYK